MKADAIVLGAGIVGTSVALHLAMRGRRVVLVDRREPGEETSYGNSGVIGRSSLLPMSFPRRFAQFAEVVRQRYPGAHYHATALPGLAPWLFAYWRASEPSRMAESARLLAPLVAAAVDEHARLAEIAGACAFLPRRRLDEGLPERSRLCRRLRPDRDRAAPTASPSKRWIGPETLAAEPHLNPIVAGSTLWTELRSVSDPGRRGQGDRSDAAALRCALRHRRGALASEGARRLVGRHPRRRRHRRAEAVVALGPWSLDVLAAARLPAAARGQARLPHALRRQGQCHAQPARPRRGAGLCHHADGQGHPAHHRLGIRPARRAAKPGPARGCRARRPGAVPARWPPRGASRGWARGRAFPTCVRRSGRRRATRACGLPSATSIRASRSARRPGGCSPS